MNDTLERIVAAKKQWLDRNRQELPIDRIEQMLANQQAINDPRGFARQLRERISRHGIGVIAECKRASPSAGLIREDYDPALLAKGYAEAGAACISVLTEQDHFRGDAEDMRSVSQSCPLPVLCKDFIFDEWQIAHARLHGADCILLIAALLDEPKLKHLSARARQYGVDTLVEVHDESELDRALSCQATLIGINNRNLKDLSVDLDVSIRLRALVPKDQTLVSESGIADAQALQRLLDNNLSAFLIGEHLLRQANPGKALAELLDGIAN